MVQDVAPGSPAADAGLKSGDEIVKIDDKAVKDFEGLMSEVAKHKPGDKVNLQVMREGKQTAVAVTLGHRPGVRMVMQPEKGPAVLGIETGELTPAAKERLGVTVDAGAVVEKVVPNSPAAAAGLQPGDVITKLDGKAIADPTALQEAVRKAGAGKEVTITVARGKESKDLKAKLEAGSGSFTISGLQFELSGPSTQKLEQRIDQLEKRVQELEKKLNQQPPK